MNVRFTHYHLDHVSNRTYRDIGGRLRTEKVYRVKVRLTGGVVFTHKYELNKFQAEDLVEKMMAEEVHKRSFLEMRRSRYWEPADHSLFVHTSHAGRFGGGRFSYTVYASSRSELEAWVASLYAAWHPMGYGTIANPIAVFRRSLGVRRDVYQVTATRWGSCD